MGTLDGYTCDVCGDMDSKVFDMKDFAPGSTAPPFHPWCRCATCPYFADMEGLGERFARDVETGERYKVPGDMTYKQWKEQYATEETEKGISGKKSKATAENTVDVEYIHSKAYRDKFSELPYNEEVQKSIYSQAKSILEHRKGTYYEDVYTIDADTGKVVTKCYNSKTENETAYTKFANEIIAKNPDKLISVHNHGTNNPPTGSDFVSAGRRKYKSGVVICHNGDIYYYKAGKKPFSSKSFGKVVDNNRVKGYNEVDAIIETLEYFKQQYGIDWRKL